MLEMNLIKILDSDRDPRVSILKSDTEPFLEEYDDVFEGLVKLDGQYIHCNRRVHQTCSASSAAFTCCDD